MKQTLDETIIEVPEPRRMLVHMCCGPCSIYPLKTILTGKAEVWGFFFNPNIHPRAEFIKRLEAVKKLAGLLSIDVIYHDQYRPGEFVKGLKAHGGGQRFPQKDLRCEFCYAFRLEETAKAAHDNGFDSFSSSLLYSHSQNHAKIKELGVDLGRKYGILFYYDDFRKGWQAGIDDSVKMGLYRQRYCGCAYSKIERYADKKTVKKQGVGRIA